MIPEVSDPLNLNVKFLCGVVEGFYGRPWTSEQRRTLFKYMKKISMNTYLYAPKDDCKHRMYWREQYSVEEADHLTSLIQSAKENNVQFVYAISPGLDITFSSTKDVTLLKKKLEQVASFGCRSFALLFDDIEVEMCEADKEIFQTFAQAQVSVTNEVYQHLGQPCFLFCPTEYCASRAVPSVANSEYLNTIGAKLLPSIDIMWTGPMVISKRITVKHVEELTSVLRRPPVIWDNIHANDYDRKRVFLGPFDGRAPELIPHVRGVMTNPNCQFEANYIPMHTLAQWSRTNVDLSPVHGSLPGDSPLRAEIKLETESDYASDEDIPSAFHSAYKPRQALSIAIEDWLEVMLEDNRTKTKVIPPSLPIPIPIALPTTVPPVENLNELGNVEVNSSLMQPSMSLVPLNSLVDSGSESDNESCASERLEPMDCAISPGTSPSDSITSPLAESVDSGIVSDCTCEVGVDPMQVDLLTPCSSCGGSQRTTPSCSTPTVQQITHADISLFVDYFYLPFEHGSQSLDVLRDLHWLKMNASAVFEGRKQNATKDAVDAYGAWKTRANNLYRQVEEFCSMVEKFCGIPNQAVMVSLFPYMCDMKGVLLVVKSFVEWLAMGRIANLANYLCPGSPHTCANPEFAKIFSSGDHEPWAFQGGLQAEFHRMLPLDASGDLLLPILPLGPTPVMHNIRPYSAIDETAVYELCLKTYQNTLEAPHDHPDYPMLIPDKLVGTYTTLYPEFCWLIEDKDGTVIGYVLAAPNIKSFHRNIRMVWAPSMQAKYPLPDDESTTPPQIMDVLRSWHNPEEVLIDEHISSQFPAEVLIHILPSACVLDPGVPRRALACASTALRTSGSFGVHVRIPAHQRHTAEAFYKLGFYDLSAALNGAPPSDASDLLLGRKI